jgi:hypothetical protein
MDAATEWVNAHRVAPSTGAVTTAIALAHANAAGAVAKVDDAIGLGVPEDVLREWLARTMEARSSLDYVATKVWARLAPDAG